MHRTPWWALLSATAAPVFMIGGWTLAARLQPGDFNEVRETISALAGVGIPDRWIMTVGLVGLGVCHLVTALGLRCAALPGRAMLAIGGVAQLFVAAFPVPRVGSSLPHSVSAAIGFGALALWPALACWRRKSDSFVSLVPPLLRPRAGIAATVGMLALYGWFVVELFGEGPRIGLSERLFAAAESLWPLAVVLSARLVQDRQSSGEPAIP